MTKNMILNTGARTDTVQYFTPWLLKRFEEGYVLARNPLFPSKVTRYELSPDNIDLVLFCSKNYQPILQDLHKITDRYPAYFHYTITVYGKDLEPGVPNIETSIETLKELSAIVGKKRVSWRYDPILLTEYYTVEKHKETFAYMAKKIAPYIDRCIFNFVELYKKLQTNMPELHLLTTENKQEIPAYLGEVAKKNHMTIQTCGKNGDFTKYGIGASGCATLDIFGQANGLEFRKLKHKGMREGCGCIESRDIGAYDTCLNGCKYCYANKSPQKAYDNYKFHNPDAPLLLGELKETDIVTQGNQKSFLKKKSMLGEQTLDAGLD